MAKFLGSQIILWGVKKNKLAGAIFDVFYTENDVKVVIIAPQAKILTFTHVCYPNMLQF